MDKNCTTAEQNAHDNFMQLLQDEWENDREKHRRQRDKYINGIRSSQISALVMLLVKMGKISEQDVHFYKLTKGK